MIPVRYLDEARQVVWEPKGPDALGIGEDCQAIALMGPKLIVFNERFDFQLNRLDASL